MGSREDIKPFRIMTSTVVLGSYGYEENVWGYNTTREEAEQTCRDLEGKEVSGEFLGLPMELRFPLYGRYKIVRCSLYDLRAPLDEEPSQIGLVLAECEAVEPLALAVLYHRKQNIKELRRYRDDEIRDLVHETFLSQSQVYLSEKDAERRWKHLSKMTRFLLESITIRVYRSIWDADREGRQRDNEQEEREEH
jgi:hypothetical protein